MSQTPNSLCVRICSWIRFGLLALVIVNSAASAREGEFRNQIHGPAEFLRESLPQSPEFTRLLLAAERELQQGTGDTAFPALLEIFAQDFDQFTVVRSNQPGSSVYQRGLDLLQRAGPETRKAWLQTVEPLAVAALRKAAGKPDRLQRVAREYPLTSSGRIAGHLAATIAYSRGERALAKALRNLSPNSGLPHQLQEPSADVMAGREARVPPVGLSVPLPAPLWRWHVPLWQTPNAIPFADLAKPFFRTRLSANTWRPILAGDTLYMRTPFHVIAMDKTTGAVLWTIKTDTFEPGDGRLVPKDSAPSEAEPSELLRMDTLGNLLVSDRYLYFVDYYRLLRSPAEFQFGGGIGPPPGLRGPVSPQPLRSSQGSRLVAVELTSQPRIAWTAGTAPSFDYQIVNGGFDRQPAATETPDEETVTGDASFNNVPETRDRFCGVPVARGQILFAVTFDGSSYWLNCLSQSSGKIRWRRPVLNHTSMGARPGRMFTSAQDNAGASLCGVSGDVVVCALDSGVALGVAVADGRLLWATNLRRPSVLKNNRSLQARLAAAMYSQVTLGFPGMRSHPLIRDGRLYWASSSSDDVHCIDVNSGKIIWRDSKLVQQPGRMEGSRDDYVLTTTDSSVILIGNRHIRAVDKDTGAPLWVTPIGEQTGRAYANESTALIPQLDGKPLQVDLRTGRRGLLAESTASSTTEYFGSVVADDETVAFVTPVSAVVAALPGDSAVHNSIVDRARFSILQGDTREALRMLHAASDNSVEARQQLKDSLFAIAMSETTTDGVSPAEATQWLDRIPLSLVENIRRRLLDPRASVDFATDTQFPQPRLVQLSDEWRVRWDVAALARDPQRQSLDPLFLADVKARLQREWAILSPSRVGAIDHQLTFADQMIRDRRFTAAELFLLSALADAGESDAVRLKERIRRLRETLKPHGGTESSGDEASRIPSDVEVVENLRLYSGQGLRGVREQQRSAVDTPGWYPNRLYLTSRSIVSVDMALGVEVARLQLPATTNSATRVDAFDVPSVVPIYGEDRIGVVSLLHPDGPRLLWWKPIERKPHEYAPLELGTFNSRFVTVNMGARFFCLHTLTGEMLWERTTTDDTLPSTMTRRIHRLTGGTNVVARYSRKMGSYELHRALDGAPITTRRLEIPAGQVPLQDGESILYQKDKRLVMHSTLTGVDLLGEKDPILLAGAGQAQQLPGHRIITMNRDLEIVIMSTRTGEVELRCPVDSLTSLDQIVGLKAFERDGTLMVLLKDWNNSRSSRTASSRMGEERLDSGLLLAIDPETAAIRWHRKTKVCVAPTIHGAPSGLFVTWAWKNPDRSAFHQLMQRTDRSNWQNTNRNLVVSVYDLQSGRTLAEAENLSPAEPLRCVHDRSAREVLLESESSQTRLKYR